MDLLEYARRTVAVWRREEISFMAAAVAFYAFLAAVPLVLILVAVVSALGGGAAEDRIAARFAGYLSPQGHAVVGVALSGDVGRFGASAVGSAVLLWTAFRLFAAVDIAFGRVYAVRDRGSTYRRFLRAGVVLAALALGAALMLGLGALLALVEDVALARALGYAALVAGLAVVFAPMYAVMSPVRVGWRHVLPGTATVVAGWLVLQSVFQVFLTLAPRYQAYGFFGTVLAFLLWLYFSANLVLVGAIVNAVAAGER